MARQFFRDRIVRIGIELVLLYWVVESVMDSLVFHDRTVIERILPLDDPEEMWTRFLYVVVIGAFVFYARRSIAEVRRSEEAVRQVNLQRDFVLNSLPLVFYSLRASGDFPCTWMNGQVERVTGFPANRFIDEASFWISRVHPDDRESVSGLLEEALQTGAFAAEYRWKHADGSYRWFLDKHTILRDNQDIPREAFGVYVDISRLKEAQQSLQTSEARYRTLVETSPDAILLFNLQADILSCNRVAVELYGADTADELLGRSGFDFLAPEDLDRARGNMSRILNGETMRGIEYRVLKRDGTRLYIELSVSPVTGKDGKPKAFVGIFRDIMDRKEAEAVLEHNYSILRQTLEGTIRVLALTVETRDRYTAGHQRGVAKLAAAIAQEIGLTMDQSNGTRLAAMVHDIGKLSIPAEILGKPGRLSETELRFIKCHPQVAYEILKTVEFPWPVAQIVLQHHEQIDGSGYPSGLKGEEILLEARIIRVADVVEAMASHRPYRPALGIDAGLEEILRNSGVLYDPGVVDACLKVFREKRFDFAKDNGGDTTPFRLA
ncbi:MAG: PAS domain S-box protein [Chloroflexi bacterium]|nr:PAS domain S-box protein [Chloroflexota bacterium]